MASVTIELSPETEKQLRDRATENGQSVEAFLRQLAEQAATVKLVGPPSNRMTPEQWSAEFRTWVASHRPVPGSVDDSRVTIYAGRGE
jgi:plasmid stability protein